MSTPTLAETRYHNACLTLAKLLITEPDLTIIVFSDSDARINEALSECKATLEQVRRERRRRKEK